MKDREMAQAPLTRVLDDIKILKPEELQRVEQAIRVRLPQHNGTAVSLPLTSQQIEAANALLRETIVTLPKATGADNESIDADLAREYGDDNEKAFMHLPAWRFSKAPIHSR